MPLHGGNLRHERGLTRTRSARYSLKAPDRLAPWASALGGVWTRTFGASRATTPLLIAALSAGRAPNTYTTYQSAWNKFLLFAQATGLHPLRADQRDMCHYAAWLANQGTVDLSSCQPYFSAINAIYSDLGLKQPAAGELLARVRAGLRRMQVDNKPRERTLALPATVAKHWHDAATTLAKDITDNNVRRLRNLLACTLGFLTMSRPVSIVTLSRDDGVLLHTEGETGLVVCRSQVKTAHTKDLAVPGRAALSYPRSAFAALVQALGAYERYTRRHRFSYFFQLPGDVYTEPAETNGSLLTTWFNDAVSTVPDTPPSGALWTPRSLRSGGASAAEAACVPRSKTEYVGGWAPGSTALSKHYIDPTYQHTSAGQFFFGHLAR